MSPKARTMFVGIPLLALGSVAATLQVTSGTLSATRIVLNGEVRAIATGPSGELHVLLQSGSVLRYRDGDISAVPGTFGRQATRAIAVGPTGRLFLLQEQSAQVIEPTGIEGRTLPIPALASIAIRSDGKLFVASPTRRGVLHLISAAGQIEASFGSVASVTNDAAQNRFLSQALIMAGSGGTSFFVPTTSTVPIVKVYDAEGHVLREFAVEGESVSRQASEAARALSNRSTSQCTGGYIVLTAAAVDATSGHLFVGTTQAPSAPNLYEYSPLGVKVAEYIVRAPDGEEIAFVDGLAVNRDSLYVLSNRTLYRASLRQRVSRVAINEVLARWSASRSNRDTTGRVHAAGLPLGVKGAKREACPCPNNISTTCGTDCSVPGYEPDCNATLRGNISLSGGDTIYSHNCTATYNDKCTQSMTQCDYSNDCSPVSHGPLTVSCPKDADGDGFSPDVDPLDCRDDDPDKNPGETIYLCEYYLYGDDYNCNGVDDTQECLTPIIVDVEGDGYVLTSRREGVAFDLVPGGTKELVPWTALNSDDAWLVFDRNGNGKIDDGTELFGKTTPQPLSPQMNGFEALRLYDAPEHGGNLNGLIDSNDAIFARLELWRDADHDGTSTPNELTQLSVASVRSISLDYRDAHRRDRWGNLFRYRAAVKDTREASVGRWAFDVILNPR
jgi:ribosome modulation factor